MTRFGLAIGLIFLAVSFATADEDQAAKKVELKKGDRIIFFGDSSERLAAV